MSDSNEIFEGKTFQDLTKDIYENTNKKKLQIDLLISEIHGFITTIDESMLLSESEKEELMSTLQDSVQDLQDESDRLNKIKDDTLKTKKDFMGN